jgi:hypothetical protein
MTLQQPADEVKNLERDEFLDLEYKEPVDNMKISQLGHHLVPLTGVTMTIEQINAFTIRITRK